MRATKVVLLTNHSLLAAGVQRLIMEDGKDMEISLVAADDSQWLARVRQLLPDVIVLDSGDATLGEGAIPCLLKEHPRARVVALSLNQAGIEVYRMRRLLHTNVAGLLDAVRCRESSSHNHKRERQSSRIELGGGGAMGP